MTLHLHDTCRGPARRRRRWEARPVGLALADGRKDLRTSSITRAKVHTDLRTDEATK
jgi:hypothetical protein